MRAVSNVEFYFLILHPHLLTSGSGANSRTSEGRQGDARNLQASPICPSRAPHPLVYNHLLQFRVLTTSRPKPDQQVGTVNSFGEIVLLETPSPFTGRIWEFGA